MTEDHCAKQRNYKTPFIFESYVSRAKTSLARHHAIPGLKKSLTLGRRNNTNTIGIVDKYSKWYKTP
ncbi:hypothetical protein DPMN_174973 [Dreissena polymorpha]|uniref:Uncharacterized protein n=1 Tax=Dreissena polymorpha TaxID=45954 RepID=A0A9D4E5L9_DREPO|nr:hypothetical protein DPMN_174973 [Dreissena polymorpha]